MDYTTETNYILNILGLQSLEENTIDQLCDSIDAKLLEEISKKEAVRVCIAWLNERLKIVDNSNENDFSQELQSWCDSITQRGFGNDFVLNEVCVWRQAQVGIEPSCARRLDLAELEIRAIFNEGRRTVVVKQPSTFSQTGTTLAELEIREPCHEGPSEQSRPSPVVNEENTFGKMHPDRVLLASGIEAQQGHAGDTIIVELGNTKNLNDTNSDGSDATREDSRLVGATDLSFLTGANRMVSGDKSRMPPAKNSSKKKGNRKMGKDVSRLLDEERVPETSPSTQLPLQREGKKDPVIVKATGAPPKGYTCDRCGIPGHFKYDCPTNLDPSKDRLPPETYQCNICKSNKHFISLCPRNKNPCSITQQRRKAAQSRRRESKGKVDRKGVCEVVHHSEESEMTRNNASYQQSNGDGHGWQLTTSHRERYGSSRRESQSSSLRLEPYDDYYESRSPRETFSPGQQISERSVETLGGGGRPSLGTKRPQNGRNLASDDVDGPRDSKKARMSKVAEISLEHVNEGRLSPWDDEDIVMSSSYSVECHKSQSPNHRSPYDTSLQKLDFHDAVDFLGEFGGLFLNVDENEPEDGPKLVLRDDSSMLTENITLDKVTFDEEDLETREPSPAIEFRVTIKSLEQHTPYHPRILQLFQNMSNVWVNKVKRTSAADLWLADDKYPENVLTKLSESQLNALYGVGLRSLILGQSCRDPASIVLSKPHDKPGMGSR